MPAVTKTRYHFQAHGDQPRRRSHGVQADKDFSNSQHSVPTAIHLEFLVISNGNKTEWSPVRSVIVRVITKSDDHAAGVRFFFITSMITDRIRLREVLLPIYHKNYNFREKKNSQGMKEREKLQNGLIG